MGLDYQNFIWTNFIWTNFIWTIVGVLGISFILLAFILDEFVRKVNRDTVSYNLLNIFGSFFLICYALSLSSWPFVVLNAVWMVAALIKLGKIISCRHISSYKQISGSKNIRFGKKNHKS